MKKLTLASAIFFLLVSFNYSCTNSQATDSKENDSVIAKNSFGGYNTQVEYGEHLVTIVGCTDCHTSKKMTSQGPVPNDSLFLSGNNAKMPLPVLSADQLQKGIAATTDETSWVGAWGNSFSANITSDATGIGNWTEEQFINCLRKGLYKGLDNSRPLMPPMPWRNYSKMSDDELKAVFAFLKSTKPIDNVVPAYIPSASNK